MDTVDTTQLAKYVETVLQIYYNMEGTKHMAVAASTLLVYDIVSTLPSEAKYIWGSPWTFARIMFHVNRCFSLALMCIYVPTLFMHRLSISTCVAVSLFYTYGTIFVMGIITSVLMVRVWLIYGKNKWVLVGLVSSCALTTIPSIIIFQISLMKASWIPNPAPELITACLFTGNPLAFLPYITSLIYETVIFGLTIYKTWRMSRAYMATPLMTRLLRDGSSYYFIVMISIILTMLGALHPLISGAAIGSGWLVAIMSSMCSRLILSTRAFYNRDDEDQATDDFAMDNLSPLPRGLNNNRAQVSTSSSSGSQVKEWRQPPGRKPEQDAERQDAGRQLACGLNGQVEENKIGTAWSEKVSQHRVYRIGRI